MAFTEVVVTGTWNKSGGPEAGQPSTGQVTFQLYQPLTDGTGLQLPAAPIVADLDADGSISLTLAANDDTTTRPVGIPYLVVQLIDGVRFQYYVTIPHTAGGDPPTVDLATLAPTTAPPPAQPYATDPRFPQAVPEDAGDVYVVQDDGSLALAPQSGSGGSPGGPAGSVQVNGGGSFVGSSAFAFDGTELVVTRPDDGDGFRVASSAGPSGSHAYLGVDDDGAEGRVGFWNGTSDGPVRLKGQVYTDHVVVDDGEGNGNFAGSVTATGGLSAPNLPPTGFGLFNQSGGSYPLGLALDTATPDVGVVDALYQVVVTPETVAASYTTPALTGPVTGDLTVTVDGGSPIDVPVSGLSVADTATAIGSAVGSAGSVSSDGSTITVTSASIGPLTSVELVADSAAQAAGFAADSGVVFGAVLTCTLGAAADAGERIVLFASLFVGDNVLPRLVFVNGQQPDGPAAVFTPGGFKVAYRLSPTGESAFGGADWNVTREIGFLTLADLPSTVATTDATTAEITAAVAVETTDREAADAAIVASIPSLAPTTGTMAGQNGWGDFPLRLDCAGNVTVPDFYIITGGESLGALTTIGTVPDGFRPPSGHSAEVLLLQHLTTDAYLYTGARVQDSGVFQNIQALDPDLLHLTVMTGWAVN